MSEIITEENVPSERFEKGEALGGLAELVYSDEDVDWLHRNGISDKAYDTPAKAEVLRNTMAENPEFAAFVLDQAKKNPELAEVIEIDDSDEEFVFESQEHNLLSAKYLQHELLTKEEEASLAKRIERGDLHAKAELTEKNLRLVVSNMKPYLHLGLDRDDLFQNGCLGLQRAVEKFDWRKEFKFSTYATWWVRQAMQRGIANEGKLIRVPVHIGDDLGRISRAEREYLAGHPEPRTAAERQAAQRAIVEKAKLRSSNVDELLRIRHVTSGIASLDKTVNQEGDTTLGDLQTDFEAADPVKEVIASDRAEKLREGIAKLGQREQRLLTMRFGLDGTEPINLKGIADCLGISPQRTHQVEVVAMRKLSSLLGESFGQEMAPPQAGDGDPDPYQRGENLLADELLDHLQTHANGTGERNAVPLKNFTDDYRARGNAITKSAMDQAKNHLAAKRVAGWRRDSDLGFKAWLMEKGAKA